MLPALGAGSHAPRRWRTIGCLLLLAGAAAIAQTPWPPAERLKLAAETELEGLPPSVRATAAEGGGWRCEFRYQPTGAPQRVTLAGTFNGWNRDVTPLAKSADGAWSARVLLPAGQHQYKFVEDGERWIADPQNPAGADDNHGGRNSLLRIGRLARLLVSDGVRGDGRIDAAALEHDPARALYFQALPDGAALLRYRTLARDVEHVWVAVRGGEQIEMQTIEEGPLFALHEAKIRPAAGAAPSGPNARPLEYAFILADGVTRGCDPNVHATTPRADAVFATPDWARDAIWYQIMVDRFRNGRKDNDPDPVHPWTSDWFAPAPYEKAREEHGQTFYNWYVFDRLYGGDIDGLEQQLGYLKDLGVNAIYLNPIFKSHTHHKYDAMSYIHVDDHFGTKGDFEPAVAKEDLLDPATWTWTETDRRFLAFLRKAHEMGFRVILDGVFNHVGERHTAFVDVKTKGKESRFADWFDVISWEPFRYSGWAGFGGLPSFAKTATGLRSESLKQHIFHVTRRWMDPDGDGDPRDGIDGWRLDVPNEVPMPFWEEWRRLVKSINPNAYITGEIWDRADAWLDGRHFDAVMNYPFARAVVAWVFDRRTKIRATEFDRRLREVRLAYPLAATQVMQNLMDSHDTDRVASMAFNPDRAYDAENRVQDNGPKYNNDKPNAEAYARVRLAAALQMTYVGAPMIYYGDEAGMWGADDPTCRKPMLWLDLQPYEKPEQNFAMRELTAYYKVLTDLRRAHASLRRGDVRTLLADDAADVWAVLRADEREQAICVANASTEERSVRIPLPPGAPTMWQGVLGPRELLQAADGALVVRVAPLGMSVVVAAETGSGR